MSKILDNVTIKKANQTESYSEEHVAELTKCIDKDTGYLYFLKTYFYIQHPTKGQLLFDPYDFQLRLVENFHNHRFNINMLPRQTGKTTSAVGYLLWHAMFRPDQTILIAAHKGDGAKEIMQRIRYGYEMCPDFIRAGVVGYNKHSIEFENGSRIIAQTTTETTGRGMSISILYVDEMAYLPPGIAEDFWTSISPTIATGGRAIVTSTPNSDEDTFANIWHEACNTYDEFGNETEVGTNGFKAYSCHWSEHPDRDEIWKREEIKRIGEDRFRREYNLEFLIFDETLINSIKLANMIGVNPVKSVNHVRWYKELSSDMMYVVALDPSMGTGSNNSAIQIYEIPTYEQVGEWMHNQTDTPGQMRIMKEICSYIKEERGTDHGLYWSVENNTLGEAALVLIDEFGEETFPGIFVSEPKKKNRARRTRKGFNTTQIAKIEACSKLKTLIENDKFRIKSKPMISELKTFIANGSSYAAKGEKTDDLVTSTLLIIRILDTIKQWEQSIHETYIQVQEDEYDIAPLPIFGTFST